MAGQPARGAQARATVNHACVSPSEREAMLARESVRRLFPHLQTDACFSLRVTGGKGSETIELPACALSLLADILGQAARGHPLTVTSLAAELTAAQAAELLNVSTPYVVKLMDEGEIPCRGASGRRMILTTDFMEYRTRQAAKQDNLLDELTAMAQETGEYD